MSVRGPVHARGFVFAPPPCVASDPEGSAGSVHPVDEFGYACVAQVGGSCDVSEGVAGCDGFVYGAVEGEAGCLAVRGGRTYAFERVVVFGRDVALGFGHAGDCDGPRLDGNWVATT